MWVFLTSFFTLPVMLIGVAAAAVPIIIHLIYKRRAPKVPFPTLMFLLASVRETAHRKRLQELLLLAMRSLVLFLLAIGLAGFHLPSLGGGSADAAIGIVLDNSFSMATQSDTTTRYAQAKELVRKMIEDLGKGSSVVLCYSNVTPPMDEGKASPADTLTQDRELVLSEVIASDVSYGSGSVTSAIANAEKALSKSANPMRFIYVISDLQSVGWKSLGEAEAGKAEDKSRSIPLIVADCGSGGYRNLAVTAVDTHGKGRAAGVPLMIEARLLNSSTQSQNVVVKMFADKREPIRRTVTMEAGATASVSFTTTFDNPGAHTGWVEIETQDSLEADNRRYFAVNVTERIPALLVKKENANVPLLDPAFYLVRALDPAQSGTASVHSIIQPTELLAERLATADLGGYPVVYLLDVPQLGEVQLAALASYVRAGGTLVVFPGDGVDRVSYNHGAEAAIGLFPATFGEPVGNLFDEEKYSHIAEMDTSAPLLVPFKMLPRATFESVRLRRWHTLAPVKDRSVSILGKLDTGTPFLVEGKLGVGRVLMFCIPAGADWSNFPARVLYQPLMHEIVYAAVGSLEQSLSHAPGAPVNLGVAHPVDDMELTDPLGTVRRHIAPKEFSRWTYTPGVYRWKEMKEPDREGAFVVNAVPEESDLTPLPQEKVKELLAGRDAQFVANADEARRVVVRLRKGVQLWSIVLFLVLAIAVAECFFSNRPQRKDDEKSRITPTFSQRSVGERTR